ncbi:MAG: hypothetical protein J6D26_04470 [Clostridia bacterium]|nr:hypothetical protein [Clostridia bacterium]
MNIYEKEIFDTGFINKNEINAIRVGHPERMKKADYVNLIVNYITK